MTSIYNPWLVGLSVTVAILAAYTSLRLASRVADSRGTAGHAWLLLGAISMGVGIWAMHFIGMLALTVPISLRYGIGLTAASLGIAIVTSGFAIRIASSRKLELPRLTFCSLIMGVGIAAMHYTGMEAITIAPARVGGAPGRPHRPGPRDHRHALHRHGSRPLSGRLHLPQRIVLEQ